MAAKDIGEYKLGIFDAIYQGVAYEEFQISTKDGDVIARIEDGETLQLKQIASEIPGTTTLVSTEYTGGNNCSLDRTTKITFTDNFWYPW